MSDPRMELESLPAWAQDLIFETAPGLMEHGTYAVPSPSNLDVYTIVSSDSRYHFLYRVERGATRVY